MFSKSNPKAAWINMGNIFAKKSKPTRITEQDKAVLVC